MVVAIYHVHGSFAWSLWALQLFSKLKGLQWPRHTQWLRGRALIVVSNSKFGSSSTTHGHSWPECGSPHLMHSVHSHAQFATLNAFHALQVWYYYCCGRNLLLLLWSQSIKCMDLSHGLCGLFNYSKLKGLQWPRHTMVTMPGIGCGLQQQVWQFLAWQHSV